MLAIKRVIAYLLIELGFVARSRLVALPNERDVSDQPRTFFEATTAQLPPTAKSTPERKLVAVESSCVLDVAKLVQRPYSKLA